MNIKIPEFELDEWSIALDWLEDNRGYQEEFVRWLKERFDFVLDFVNELISNKSEAGQFSRFSIPLVRRIYPQLIAEKIVSVQPLMEPTGLKYYLQHRHSQSSELSALAEFGLISSAINGMMNKIAMMRYKFNDELFHFMEEIKYCLENILIETRERGLDILIKEMVPYNDS